MNRNEELSQLLLELERTPEVFDQLAQKARRRLRRERQRRIFWVPCVSLAAAFVLFIALVNTFPSFAQACSRVPVFGRLAEAVSFSPSLRAAVEQEYVQELNLSQTRPGVTMTVDYLIVDQKQVNIFYTLYSSEYDSICLEMEASRADGSPLEGYGLTIMEQKQSGGLRQAVFDFMDQTVPDALLITCTLSGRKIQESSLQKEPSAEYNIHDYTGRESDLPGNPFAEFTFLLEFDPDYTSTGEYYPVGTDFELDGNRFTLESADIYPTFSLFRFSEAADNADWLKELTFYAENGKGERFGKLSNGFSATGGGTPSMLDLRLESSFFSGEEDLTITITGAKWLSRDYQPLRLDLLHGTWTGSMPEGVSFLKAEKKNGGCELSFLCSLNEDGSMYSPFHLSAQSKSYGKAESLETSSVRLHPDDESLFTYSLYLPDYTEDIVELDPVFTHCYTARHPINLTIR